jgi:Sec-independent protein translocase protein TatA
VRSVGTCRLHLAGDREGIRMSNISWRELLVILALAALVFFVPKKVPHLFRYLRTLLRGSKAVPREGESVPDKAPETAEPKKDEQARGDQ